MRVLIPDVQFDGEPTVEIEAFEGKASFDVYHAKSGAEIPDDVLRACDAVLLWHIVDVDPAMVAKLDNCKIIARLGIGYDRINTAACGERGIRVSNVPSYDVTDVVNSTIAIVLALQRGLLSYHEELKADIRRNWAWEGPPALRRARSSSRRSASTSSRSRSTRSTSHTSTRSRSPRRIFSTSSRTASFAPRARGFSTSSSRSPSTTVDIPCYPQPIIS